MGINIFRGWCKNLQCRSWRYSGLLEQNSIRLESATWLCWQVTHLFHLQFYGNKERNLFCDAFQAFFGRARSEGLIVRMSVRPRISFPNLLYYEFGQNLVREPTLKVVWPIWFISVPVHCYPKWALLLLAASDHGTKVRWRRIIPFIGINVFLFAVWTSSLHEADSHPVICFTPHSCSVYPRCPKGFRRPCSVLDMVWLTQETALTAMCYCQRDEVLPGGQPFRCGVNIRRFGDSPSSDSGVLSDKNGRYMFY